MRLAVDAVARIAGDHSGFEGVTAAMTKTVIKRKVADLKPHPRQEADFPNLADPQLRDLADDIQRNGALAGRRPETGPVVYRAASASVRARSPWPVPAMMPAADFRPSNVTKAKLSPAPNKALPKS
jgi:hypothetical protein